jgi:hypothetical protein
MTDQETRSLNARKHQEETLRHLRNAIAITDATSELGASTLAELAEQGETLARIQGKVDQADAHAEQGKHILRGMGSVWGAAMNKFRKSPPEAQAHAATLAVKRRARLALEKAAAKGKDGEEGGGGESDNGELKWNKNSKECELCKGKFSKLGLGRIGVGLSRHHCRACGKNVCGSCSVGEGDLRACVDCCADVVADEDVDLRERKKEEQEILARQAQAAAKRGGGSGSGGSDASLALGGGNAALRAQIEAEDELLAQISTNVSRIGAVSREMTSELKKQDKQLDELNKSVDKVTEKVVQNSKAAKKLTK